VREWKNQAVKTLEKVSIGLQVGSAPEHLVKWEVGPGSVWQEDAGMSATDLFDGLAHSIQLLRRNTLRNSQGMK